MVRFAQEKDLEQVNRLRAQVSALHAAGRPDIFKPGFGPELRERAAGMIRAEDSDILVAERDGVICGMAGVEYLFRPESAYCQERRIYHVIEFAVDGRCRRQGVGRELVDFMGKDARARGFSWIELDVWAFNESALAFYEALGFQTCRRYMELNLEPGE